MTVQEQYLAELKQYLGALTADEQAEVTAFYDEYLFDADLTTRAEIEKRLGSPRQLSRKILADYSIHQEENSSADATSSPQSKIKLTILILLAATSMLTIGGGIILFGGFITMVAVLFSFGITALAILAAIFVAGFVAIYMGMGLLFTNWAVGLFYLGAGLSCLAGFLIMTPLCIMAVRGIARGISNFTRYCYTKIKERRAVR